MNDKLTWDFPCWYVIHTHPKQEERATSNLRVLGVETFNPKIKEHRYNQYANALIPLTKPLFPRYIFTKLIINNLYHKVRFTRGIHSFVNFGSGPATIDESIIYLMQSKIGKDGFVTIDEEFGPGDKVIIKDGLLKNFAGIFEREMKDADRVRILLQTVNYQAHVEIERGLIKKVGSLPQYT